MYRVTNLRFKLQTFFEAIVALPRMLRDYLITQPIVASLGVLSIVLFIVFFSMLGSLNPATSGQQVPLGQVLQAAQQREVAGAVIYDEDARIQITTQAGQKVWAAYPKG